MRKFILFLAFIYLNATSFNEYKNSFKNSFNQYKTDINKEFREYKKAYDDAFKEFKQDILKNWPKAEVSTKKKFVEYDKNLKTKKVIDFKKQNIKLEVIAGSKIEAKKKFEKMFKSLLNEDVKKAFKNDILEHKVYKKLNKKPTPPKTNLFLLADIIKANEKLQMLNQIKHSKPKIVKYKNRYIYKLNIKLPPKSIIRKAKTYKDTVLKKSNKEKLPPELIFAIIHSESSFNPMARSYVPAFGLMQIVPKTAGVDAYYYLYNRKKLLSSSYLYSPEKNINIGSAYMHILYYKYLKNIKNPQSRLYCAIAAYNTGAGNVAKAFINNTNIYKASKIINNLTPQEVYKRLMKRLPYRETKNYLYKVNNRFSAYKKLLKDDRL